MPKVRIVHQVSPIPKQPGGKFRTRVLRLAQPGDEDADLIFANNNDMFKLLLDSAGATFIAPTVTARIAAVIAGDGPI